MIEPRINILTQETASKIAAGEVVEKPASVVKELVENSIDAGAKAITVEIVNGGLDLIRIVDDGRGILNEDIPRAFLPHATSKLKTIEDIFAILTLGFRGEALASVAAVSRTLLKSHAPEDPDGMEIFIEGGEEKFKKYSAIDQGTIIDVRDLFYNVPARLKFLRTSQKESANVTDLLTRLALSRPDVAITYYNNEKLVFRTYGTGQLIDVIRTVYTRKTADNVFYFERGYDDFKISGYIGNEEIARGSRNQQTIFINGRYITSRPLGIAVEQAFKSFITINKFPFFILNLDLAPESVDVNVHPQKAEVKFSDDKLMFHSVFETVHGALRQIYQGSLGFEKGLESQTASNSGTSPGSGFFEESATPQDAMAKSFQSGEGLHTMAEPTLMDHGKGLGSRGGDTESTAWGIALNASQGSLKYQTTQEGAKSTGYGNAIHESGSAARSFNGDPSENPTGRPVIGPTDESVHHLGADPTFDNSVAVRVPIDLKSDTGTLKGWQRPGPEQTSAGSWQEPKEAKTAQSTSHGIDQVNPSALSKEAVGKFPMPKILGQYQKTYILAEFAQTLYLIDQHAAHEKINFEHYMEELMNHELILQPLLLPEVIELAVDDYSVYLENKVVFEQAGFTIEEFGDRALNIREVPVFLSNINTEKYFKEILDNLKNLGKGSSREVRYLRIATVACKASIKAHDELTRPEMEHLVNELRFLKEPFTCPHGRPTMIRFTLTEIEKMFRRIQ